jgi:LAO/AO transport system kinase
MANVASVTGSDLLVSARTGDVRALARVLTSIENRTPDGRLYFAELFAASGNAWSTGITGAPGAGKSTLVSQLVPLLRVDGMLAVVAVDPSSPFSGGAILGDRIRMGNHAGDDRVYIRSLANRGALGGISETTPPVVAALDGLGFDEIVVETVGVGQSEVEVATTTDTTVVVVSPGWGDAIQVSKAGFLEIADVLVVNKADRPGAEAAVKDLESMISMGQDRGWSPPVIETVATRGTGIVELATAIADHRAHLESAGEREGRRRMAAARQLAAAIRLEADRTSEVNDLDDLVTQVATRQIDPWTAAARLLATG